MSKCTMRGEVMFPGKYICAADLMGKDVNLTIARVIKEQVRMKDVDPHTKQPVTETKWCLYFAERPEKSLILNRKTQPEAIAELHGMKAELWAGKRITIYPTTCSCYGKIVDCIRVRPTVPNGNKGGAKPEPQPEPELPPPYDGPIGTEDGT